MNKWQMEPQVLGQYMLRVFNSDENPERLVALRQRLGLHEVEAGRWYPQSLLLKYLHQLLKNDGEDVLFYTGTRLVEGTVFPPNVATFEDAVSSFDLGYTIAHRYQVGAMFGLRATGEMQLDIIAANPYPCPYDWGILHAIKKKWVPVARLSHDFSQGCRLDGETACHYHLIF